MNTESGSERYNMILNLKSLELRDVCSRLEVEGKRIKNPMRLGIQKKIKELKKYAW